MSEEKTEKAAEKPAEAKKKGGKGKLLIILSVVGVLALGGGGFAYYKFLGPGAATAEGGEAHGEAAHEEEAATGVVSFEPFVANLADPGGGRFARVSVKLIVGTEEEAKEIEEEAVTTTRLRAAILELIAAETSEHLVTPAGKAELRKKISERAAEIMKHVKVSDVLFSDFVVQF